MFFLVLALFASAFATRAFPQEAESHSNQPFVLPTDSARPGEKFFAMAVSAVRKNDYSFAVQMYKTSASWAYKPAQYNLGVIYSTGEGSIELNRPLGMAWLAMAAERGDPRYATARDLAFSHLSPAEFEQANVLWREMKKTFGDAVALRRAKNRWAQVRSEATGSHLGANVGPLAVGGQSRSTSRGKTTSFDVTGTGAVDGSIAYRQLRATDDPYDPKITPQHGEVKVSPLIPVAGDDANNK